MTAKKKLNEAYILGSMVTAGLIGLLTQSIVVFLIVMTIVIMLDIYSGSIRLD